MAAGAGYAENLRKLATFRTLEEFWGVYTHLLRADELPKDSNYHVFREGISSYLSDLRPPLFVCTPTLTQGTCPCGSLSLSAAAGSFECARLTP